jgi:hypothetical protein
VSRPTWWPIVPLPQAVPDFHPHSSWTLLVRCTLRFFIAGALHSSWRARRTAQVIIAVAPTRHREVNDWLKGTVRSRRRSLWGRPEGLVDLSGRPQSMKEDSQLPRDTHHGTLPRIALGAGTMSHAPAA